MKKSKPSLTFTVMLGYLLIATLAALAIWFIYSQVLKYTSLTESNISGNRELYLVGEAATNLYEAENLSRKVIQSGDSEVLDLYRNEIDSVRMILRALRETYVDTLLKKEVDSINLLLSRKTANLEELLLLREQSGNQSYYSKVISQLQKVDENFEDPNYEERFQELEPHQRDILIKLLEYSEKENTEDITKETLDSLVNSVKSVLTELEIADRRYRETLRKKENELLANEVNLNSQLRNLLSTIEEQERKASLSQVEASREIINKTSQIIAVLGGISLLVIFVFLFLVVKDVSRSQRYRQKLEDAKLYAEGILKSKEQFMATVTHDLRSPLNTVAGYANLLEKSDLNKAQSHYLNHVKKSSDFILRLVNDLLDLSKLEAGKMSVEKLPFNPKNLIEDTVENAIPAEKWKSLQVEVAVAGELDQPILSDPFRIKQILINLVTNATKFTEEGKISVTAFPLGNQEEFSMVIKVKDTGIGISEDKIKNIFEEFSQENNSIEKRYGGSGLGLTISKKLTELLKGTIKVESKAGKGSEFILTIPVEKASTIRGKSTDRKEFSADKINDLKVLIVDDEPAQVGLLSEFIKRTGMTIHTAENGRKALRILKEIRIDLVLTDIQMPDTDGFQLLTAIKADPQTKEIPVIALSGRTDMTPEKYIQKGFYGSLLKPYSPEKLLNLISGIFNISLNFTTPETGKKEEHEEYSLSEIQLFAQGDQKALEVILTSFITSTKINLQELKTAFSAGDRLAAEKIAHKMLPMFRQLRASQIIRQLQIIESGGWKTINYKNLEVQISRLLGELGKEIKA
ncbi:MAG TPA: ATP-binding protein [Salinimicrobium sp.]|nr:ATP-binding protein [Salinimicrobium sp.]